MLRSAGWALLMGWGVSALFVVAALAVGQVLPNAGELAFVWEPGDNRDIYALDIGRSARVRLVTNPADDWSPVWSSDGRWLAFLSERDSPKSELYILDTTTRQVQRLTHNEVSEYAPIWSPDGHQIVFTMNDSGYFHLYTLEVASSELRQVSGQAADFQPAWSPDGQHLAYVSFSGIVVSAYIVDMTGERRAQNFTPREGEYYYPSWSPDSRQVAFSWHRKPSAIVVVDREAGSVRTLTDEVPNAYAPTWSPNGRWIVFVSGGDAGDALYRMDSQGNNLRPLLTAQEIQYPPLWSSDGRWVLLASFERSWSDEGAVYVVEADGSQVRQLPISMVVGSDVVWRP